MKFCLVFLVCVVSASCTKLQEKFAWKELSFSWPDEQTKQEAIKSGSYVENHNLPLGLDVWKDKLFITVPRFLSDFSYKLENDAVSNRSNGFIELLFSNLFPAKQVSFVDSLNTN